MQIHVKGVQGKIITLDVELSYTIEEVKQEIYMKEGILPGTQSLFFGFKQLLFGLTLEDYNKHFLRDSTIELKIRLKRPFPYWPETLSPLQNPIKIQLNSNAPIWGRACKGLNLVGTCRKTGCEAGDQKVYVQIGFGLRYFEDIVDQQKCPSCERCLTSENIKSLGFFSCKFKMTALTESGKNLCITRTCSPTDGLIYFGEESIKNMILLKIQVFML